MNKFQYMIEFNGEMHLIDANTDEEAKTKLVMFLNLPGFETKDMEIFDKMPIGE